MHELTRSQHTDSTSEGLPEDFEEDEESAVETGTEEDSEDDSEEDSDEDDEEGEEEGIKGKTGSSSAVGVFKSTWAVGIGSAHCLNTHRWQQTSWKIWKTLKNSRTSVSFRSGRPFLTGN
jgi:hypothetical protein